MSAAKYFEDFAAAGDDSFTSRRRTITEADAVLFTSLTGIVDPVFTDEIFAREQLFGGRVVPGPMIMAYAMGLTDELGYGSVVAALGIGNAKFVAPARPGDTIQVTTQVGSARPSQSRPGTGIVCLKHTVINQSGVTVQTFERTLLVLGRP
ncbi:MAG TPA: MaoC family dehydratase [Streptosporangiaceae bacterium]|jgi:acyl dehydratase